MRRELSGDETRGIAFAFKWIQEAFFAADHMNRNRPGAVRSGNLDIGLVVTHNDNQRVVFYELFDKAFQNLHLVDNRGDIGLRRIRQIRPDHREGDGQHADRGGGRWGQPGHQRC